MSADQCAAVFEQRFGRRPEFVVRAPGRVNLIGEHTDYSGGLVLPMAVDRALLIAGRSCDVPRVEVHSSHFDTCFQFHPNRPAAVEDVPWSGYVTGVAFLLAQQGIGGTGAQLWIGGDLPSGAGLASSAALEVGVALSLLRLTGRKLSPMGLATLCRRAEHEYAHSACGIMDQVCCTHAKAGHALRIDCRSMVAEPVGLNLGDAAVVVIDSGIGHFIAGSEYATRRRECSAALASISDVDPAIASLRDVAEDRVAYYAEHLDDTLVRRVRHVATENARVMRATELLRTGDVVAFGRLMAESHASLRDDFEVSCEELDTIVSMAEGIDGVYGARLTGGGFGGCVIALMSADVVDTFGAAIHESYDGRYEANANVFVVRSSNAACEVETGE